MAVSFLGAQAVESGGGSALTTDSRAITLTASGSTNTKGTYPATPHIASTARPSAWLLVDVSRVVSNSDFLIDIAVGAASSEQVIVPNLPVSSNAFASMPGASWLLPVAIPAGSRLNARCQAATASAQLDVQLTLFAPMFGGERGLGRVEACGAVTATSRGTSVDPGGTNNTKGTPAELIAATSFPYKWVCVSINHTNTQTVAISWTVDIMVGAGGSEVVVVPDLAVNDGSVGDTNPAIGLCFPCSIPAGSRVSARAQSSLNTSPDRLLEVVLHGVG
jgi:hypothetical protein